MWQFFLLCIFSFELSSGARILGVVPTPSYSHQIFFRPIWKELAKRGHELTVLTTDPMRETNLSTLREIDLSFTYKLWKEDYNVTKIFLENRFNPFNMLREFGKLLEELMIQQLDHPDVQKILHNSTEHFDLFIVEYLYPGLFGFAHRFNCPYVGITSLELPVIWHSILGNPIHPVLYPDSLFPVQEDLSFGQRILSFVFTVVVYGFNYFGGFNIDPKILKKYYGENFPDLDELSRNVSLVLTNTDPTYNKRPLGPAVIPIGGGTHLTPPKPLPKVIQEFLDSAEEGVVYFSLGTNVNETDVNPVLREAFLNTFAKLPYKVLWKFGVNISGISENVKIVKWMSQQDILRHPNVKCFITQGGLQSTEEAIFNNVPIVGIPFLADQEMNIQKVEKRGMGIALNRDTLTVRELTNAIHDVIKNPKFRNKMKEISELSRDQPFTGVEKAVWWIEYVLRHKGAKHLRNHAMDVPMYQWLMLDVMLFFVVSLYLSKIIIVNIVKLLFKQLYYIRSKLKTD